MHRSDYTAVDQTEARNSDREPRFRQADIILLIRPEWTIQSRGVAIRR
jgi:hypothetical protein